ncbi:MAG: hypothetical protein AAF591_04105 [Verrucomicrobiota bacterium]
MIDNQLGRRNLEPYTRAELELKKKAILAKLAKDKERERKSKNGPTFPNSEKSNTHKEIAKAAKVSGDTLHKVEAITKKADEQTKVKLRAGEFDSDFAGHQVREERGKKVKTINAYAPFFCSGNCVDIKS